MSFVFPGRAFSMGDDTRSVPVIEAAGVGKRQPDGHPILRSIDLTIDTGTSVALVGRSGSGKTTLLSCLGLLDHFDRGDYRLMGRSIASAGRSERDRIRGRDIGFVFQKFFLLPHLSVLENVVASFRFLDDRSMRLARRQARDALATVGLAAHVHRRPGQLSGGEQQRVAVARAIAKEPKLILADEPTGSLDQTTGALVIELLMTHVREHGAALITVTHDPVLARGFDRTLELRNGEIAPITIAAPSI